MKADNQGSEGSSKGWEECGLEGESEEGFAVT